MVQETGTTNATCTLVQRDDRADGVVLYFVTAAHVFRKAGGESLPRTLAINVVVDDAHAIMVDPEDVMFPTGNMTDIAVFRAVVTHTALTPRPVLFEAPAAESVFLIAGLDGNGAPMTLPQRAGSRTTAVIVGDRDASMLDGCAGAAAMSEHGAFGIVTECRAGRPPVVALFSAARGWMSRQVPRLAATTQMTTGFNVVPRQVTGPLLLASRGEENTVGQALVNVRVTVVKVRH